MSILQPCVFVEVPILKHEIPAFEIVQPLEIPTVEVLDFEFFDYTRIAEVVTFTTFQSI